MGNGGHSPPYNIKHKGGAEKAMKKILWLMVLCQLVVFSAFCQAKEEGKVMSKVSGRKVLMIIASQNFRDEEFQVPRDLFKAQGIQVTVASSSLNEAKGMLGMHAKADILLDKARAADYDAVVYVGGSGAREYWESKQAHKLAQDTVKQNKVLGAICIAPVTLANAGLLNGKKATVFNSEVAAIKSKGANYTGKSCERDGKLITADGPSSATEFGSAIVAALGEN